MTLSPTTTTTTTNLTANTTITTHLNNSFGAYDFDEMSAAEIQLILTHAFCDIEVFVRLLGCKLAFEKLKKRHIISFKEILEERLDNLNIKHAEKTCKNEKLRLQLTECQNMMETFKDGILTEGMDKSQIAEALDQVSEMNDLLQMKLTKSRNTIEKQETIITLQNEKIEKLERAYFEGIPLTPTLDPSEAELIAFLVEQQLAEKTENIEDLEELFLNRHEKDLQLITDLENQLHIEKEVKEELSQQLSTESDFWYKNRDEFKAIEDERNELFVELEETRKAIFNLQFEVLGLQDENGKVVDFFNNKHVCNDTVYSKKFAKLEAENVTLIQELEKSQILLAEKIAKKELKIKRVDDLTASAHESTLLFLEDLEKIQQAFEDSFQEAFQTSLLYRNLLIDQYISTVNNCNKIESYVSY